MPAGIAEPDIWGESFVEAWHTRDLAQFTHYWGVAGDVRCWNGYHVPNIGTLAILVTNGRGGLPVAELAKLADYQEPIAGVLIGRIRRLACGTSSRRLGTGRLARIVRPVVLAGPPIGYECGLFGWLLIQR